MMSENEKKLLREAIWHLNGFIETLRAEPILTPDEESIVESAENFVKRASKKLRKVI